ncbi:MAG: NAD(P)-dependent oxidoreductase [Rhodospirillaceae bacterium]|nr:NAD(P)-dependent oxidoreductase [Rhodospirillaceae bacterium]
MTGKAVIGVAGCGTMGLPMARRLHAAGHEVWGFDVRPVSEFGDFENRMIADPATFADTVDTVISVVRDRRQTFDLLFDEQAIMCAARPPSNVVISSTLSPRILPKIAERLPARTMLADAPMSGAPGRAEDGTLTFMLGAPDTALAHLMPLLQAMGGDIHHLGDTGTGMTCKVVNNFVAVSSVATVRKALAASEALGLDPHRLLDVMSTSSGGTWYGDNLDQISWSREGYDPANTIGILEKDMQSFLDAVSGRDDVGVDDFAESVLDIIRSLEPLES